MIIQAKMNLRLLIDCKANPVTRDMLFDLYEDLQKRLIILLNVIEDLQIKKKLVDEEINRCSNRSKNVFLRRRSISSSGRRYSANSGVQAIIF